MNQEVGSIMKTFYDLYPVTVYESNVPKDFEMPSMYFPVPTIINGNDTNMTYEKTFSMSVKLFHSDDVIAGIKAEMIADEISANKNVIPIVDSDGELTGDFIRLTKLETRAGEGFMSLVLGWDSNYHYNREEWPPLENLELYSEVK